ncbi:MAG: L-seryl-tRNA(Sec) selenium transferase [Myxococcota bacterium]
MSAHPGHAIPDEAMQQKLRALPSVDELLKRPFVTAMINLRGRALLVRATRLAVGNVRARIKAGGDSHVSDEDIEHAIHTLSRPSLQRVINATGVVLHTNLGRAPISRAALQGAVEVAAGYSTLEFDLQAGERGSRYTHASKLISELLGAEDALVVNNCAAAVLLALSALCAGREAVVSRGELVEIGGGFRIPEVVAQGGARLREVGTTNRTRIRDYEKACGPETGVLIKIHQSNFAQVGFTESVTVAELVQLGRERGLPVLVDAGTGRVVSLPGVGDDGVDIRGALRDGADLCMFSGDKLLGGPQAGVLAGKRALIAACREHPLCRALRVDKMTLAVLEATLRLYLDGREDEIPAVHMLRLTPEALRPRADALLRALSGTALKADIETVSAKAGGGTLPLTEFPSLAVRLTLQGVGAKKLSDMLRACEPPVVARVEEERVLLDLRTVQPEEDAALLAALQRVAATRVNGGVSSC